MMPVGTNFVVGFFGHPKLIEIATGKVLRSWPDLMSGDQKSSIIWHKNFHRQLPWIPQKDVSLLQTTSRLSLFSRM